MKLKKQFFIFYLLLFIFGFFIFSDATFAQNQIGYQGQTITIGEFVYDDDMLPPLPPAPSVFTIQSM